MPRTVHEIHEFSKEDLENLAKHQAKAAIIGDIYRGKFGKQKVVWKIDGSLMVITEHTPAEGEK